MTFPPIAECLARIAERDPEIQAWVEVSPQPPLAEGPLSGIAVGVKDIFETAGVATEYGSPLFAGRRGTRDAALVAHLRRGGATILGKTHTTAFAYYDPAPTRNPRNLAHTPGGSSSGSAAAVAAGMVPFALGTQTQGSVIRPAAFCGIVGFKPTFGLLPMDGVLPFAPSLDTAGLFAESAAAMLWFWERTGLGEAVPAPLRATYTRLGEIGDAPDFTALLAAVQTVNKYEGARTHESMWRKHGAAVGVKLAELIEEGLAIAPPSYHAALAVLAEGRDAMARVFEKHPIIATPAAPGPAPLGLASTGDPRNNAPWTGLGVPVITLPLPGTAMPLGLQLSAGWNRDTALLRAAVAIESALESPVGTALGSRG